MENEILDHDESIVEFNKFRILPIILELGPLLVGLIGVAISNTDMLTIGFLTACLVYVFLSWYLFKGLKYSILDILAATFFGVGIIIILIGITFYLQNWEGYTQMCLVGHLTLGFCFVLSLIFMIIKTLYSEKRIYEFRMSQKIFSRFLILLIIFYSLGLNHFLENLGS